MEDDHRNETVHPILATTLMVVFLACGLFATAYAHLTAHMSRVNFPDQVDAYYLPPANVLKIMSLGYHEAVADLVWTEAILYFGRQIAGVRRYTYLDRYLDTAIVLNPYNKRLYKWAGAVSMYNLRRIDQASVWRSIHYLEQGHRAFPKDWQILFSLASNYLNELHSKDPKVEAKWRRIGADYLWAAANIGGGPAYLHSLAAKIWSDKGRWEVAYRRLQSVYLSTTNPAIRENTRHRLTQLLIVGSDRVLASERIGLRATLTGLGGGLFRAIDGYLESSYLLRVQKVTRNRMKTVSLQRKRTEQRWKQDMAYVPEDLFLLLRKPVNRVCMECLESGAATTDDPPSSLKAAPPSSSPKATPSSSPR
ncbi:MAG: hypothetical protein J7M25_15775 [Deltaproteobacteria bacterium]|nr:hypothetical protein [Deltaproteobacteria bacterium]